MHRLNTIIENPFLSIPLGVGGFIQSLIDWTTPLFQYIILIGTLIIVLNSCIKIFKREKKQ